MEIKILASGSKGNAYWVSDGHSCLLLECGISRILIEIALKFRLHDVAGVLISHEHQDHSKAVKELLKHGIDVYLSEGTKAALSVAGHRVHVIKAGEQFSIGTFIVKPFAVEHDCAEPLGFLIQSITTGEKLLYLTDSYYSRYLFPGLTHIMVECNYDTDILRENDEVGVIDSTLRDRVMRSHMSLDTCKALLKANDISRVQEIYLMHLSDQNSNAEQFKREVQEATGKLVVIA